MPSGPQAKLAALSHALCQAWHDDSEVQVFCPIFDPTFSHGSFGFQPGRRPLDARRRAQSHMAAGYRWVKDRRVLVLINRYLQAGMMEGGLVRPRSAGAPQGGPLSPSLSNVLLDDLDQELERRGHRLVRYTDDCNVYVRSWVAGERVMASLERFLQRRLRLKVNRANSTVARPWERSFLGYSVTNHRLPRLKVSAESGQRFRGKPCRALRRGRGQNLGTLLPELAPVLRG